MAKAKTTSELTAEQLARWKERSQSVALSVGNHAQVARIGKGFLTAQRKLQKKLEVKKFKSKL